eukprot:TRINITY_DN2150_c0_g2_i3.p1 TRINITY_DN2150_c0_g2~~TRINITY_DN2150_c0_g2_i3.p1  ORF type:complete len:129 (+),score=23.78 TRINITY_DN2150_c0_g2_i3:512-898(+)
MVEGEMAAGTERTPQSGARTLLRLMWGCQFIRVLLQEIAKDDDLSTKDALRIAYEKVLEPHHPWAVRKAVSGAIMLAPSREKFLKRLGIPYKEIEKKEYYSRRVENSLGVMCDRMYMYYTQQQLLDLP